MTIDRNKVIIAGFNPELVIESGDYPRLILSANIVIAETGAISEVDLTTMRKRLCEAICESVKLEVAQNKGADDGKRE